LPIHPNERRASVQVFFRHEAYLRESTVLAIVAIVAHEKILTGWNYGLIVLGHPIVIEHDQVIAITYPFNFKFRARESISTAVLALAFHWKARAIDEYGVVTHNDVIAGEADLGDGDHKHLINIRYLRAISSTEVNLEGGVTLPIGPGHLRHGYIEKQKLVAGPRMVERFGFTAGAVLAGVIWSSWHLPILLFADYHSATPMWFGVSCSAIMVVSMSIIMAWLRRLSGSVWTAAIFHASHNLFVQSVFTPATRSRGTASAYAIDEFGFALPATVLIFAISIVTCHVARSCAEGRQTPKHGVGPDR
jgi:hypothetical protein